MSKNKSIFNTGTLLVGAGLLATYLVVKKVNEPKEGSGTGSLGGTDDLLGQQGFDVDPNSVPEQPYYNEYPTYYVITPEGQVVPNESPTAPTNGGSGIPSNVPLASTGTGSLFQDAAATGGAIGVNLMLPSVAKRINKLIDTKYLTDAVSTEAKKTPWNKFISDPYGLNDLAVSKAEKTGTREVAELAIDKSGKTVLKTVPKWAKGVKTVANFIPLVDIPIGAGLDVYFSRYEEDPTKKIDWWSAIKANTAGELAQLGITGGAAAAASVVPVAGTIAGGVGGFVVGTGADIAATEASYKLMGKSSLFDSSPAATITQLTPAQQQASNQLMSAMGVSTSNPFSSSTATYDAATQTYTSASGAKQSMAASAPQAQAAKQINTSSSSSSSSSLPAIFQPAPNPFTSSSSSGSSSSSSSSKSSSSSSSTSSKSTSSNVSASSSASTSSAAKTSSVSTAPKTSVVSKVTSAVTSTASKAASTVSSAAKSVASKISSIFGGKKK